MRPPWITVHVFLFLVAAAEHEASPGEKPQVDGENSTTTTTTAAAAARIQREANERERRLIPYMTYYVTQSLSDPDSGARQNVFVPVPAPGENVYRFDAVPKFPAGGLPAVNLQPLPVTGIRQPLFVAPTVIQAPPRQRIQYKPKPEEILSVPQVYRLDAESVRPGIRPQVRQQRIQSETQPLRVINVNQVVPEQKLSAPRVIKIVPLVTQLPLVADRTAKPFVPGQPQAGHAAPTLPTLVPGAYATAGQSFYKEPAAGLGGNSFQGSKVYAAHVPQESPRLAVVGQAVEPENSKYAVAQIFLTTTTPSPFASDGRNPEVTGVELTQPRSNPSSAAYAREPLLTPVPDFPRRAAMPGNPHGIYFNEEGKLGEQSRIVPKQPHPLIRHLGQLPRLRVPQEENIRFVATVTPIPVTNDLGTAAVTANYDRDEKKLKTVNVDEKASLDNILSLLKETSNLPQNLTPENIDSGIKTLALILERLQQQQKSYQQIYDHPAPGSAAVKDDHGDHKKVHSFPQRSGTSTPGRPGVDYPTYSSIPQTNFDCSTQRYKGFFGDPDTNCQVWHYCDLNGGQASFLCPNGTIFSQVALTCDWWFNVKCESTSQLYVLNERLYKYILPFSPSFPEDFSGPIVDTYLAAKFKEMEARSRNKASKSGAATTTTTEKSPATTDHSSEDETETDKAV